MLKILFALFLMAHGMVHAILAAAPIPNDPDSKPGSYFTATARSWLLPRVGLNASAVQCVGILLVALVTLGFVFASLGVFGVSGLSTAWRAVVVVSSCLSLLLLILFWHSWLVVGVLINIGILVARSIMNWCSYHQLARSNGLRRIEFVRQRLKVIGVLDQVPSFRAKGRSHYLTNNP